MANLSLYTNLIESFIDGEIIAIDFEKKYLDLFKNDEYSAEYSENIFEILDTLFYAVDEYCDDADLQKQLPDSIDSEGLLKAAKEALVQLKSGLQDQGSQGGG